LLYWLCFSYGEEKPSSCWKKFSKNCWPSCIIAKYSVCVWWGEWHCPPFLPWLFQRVATGGNAVCLYLYEFLREKVVNPGSFDSQRKWWHLALWGEETHAIIISQMKRARHLKIPGGAQGIAGLIFPDVLCALKGWTATMSGGCWGPPEAGSHHCWWLVYMTMPCSWGKGLCSVGFSL
jgi:hypothetical protein